MNIKHTLTAALLLVFTVAAFALTTSIHANQSEQNARSIYIFGDSWAQRMTEEGSPIPFDQVLAAKGFDSFITVHKHGISGSTLQDWATDKDSTLTALATAIALDPTPNPIVFFTLGGNDVRDGAMPLQMATHLGIILTALEATRPDVQIVYGSYDLLNPNVQPTAQICNAGLMQLFGTVDPAVINASLYGSYESAVAVVDRFERAVVADVFGAMQGRPANPNLAVWSPAEYMNIDCLHPNSAGLTLYAEAIVGRDLAPLICSDDTITAQSCTSRDAFYFPLISK